MKYAISLLAAAAMVWMLPLSASAQFMGAQTDVVTSGTSYRIFHQRGEPTITVQLLGDIGGSGIYVLGARTTMMELLALAGGAPLGDPGPRTRRTVTVRLFREGGGMRDPIYEADIETLLRQPGAVPQLQDGDMVTVDIVVRERTDPMRILQVASTIGTFTLLILRVTERL